VPERELHQALRIVGIADIGATEQGRSTRSGDVLDECASTDFVDVGHHDLRALLCESTRRRGADALRSAGDDGHPIVELHATSGRCPCRHCGGFRR
jgi:hypothetical protein